MAPPKIWGYFQAKIAQKTRNIAGPADCDRCRAEGIFEDQVPTDDPGDEFTHRRIGISIGAAGNRHGRSHLGIAEAREGADEPGEDKREAHSRPGMGGGGIARQNEDARTDDAADTKRDKACKRQRSAQPRFARHRSEFTFFRFGLKYRDRLTPPNVPHSPSLPLAAYRHRPPVMIPGTQRLCRTLVTNLSPTLSCDHRLLRTALFIPPAHSG